MTFKKLLNRYLPLTLSVALLVAAGLTYLFLKNDNKAADAAWYSSSWTYRKPITIDHNKISQTATTTFSSFPLLISVTDTDLKYTGNGGKVASSTGADILFTDANGTTKLDHEIEKYSSSTGQLIAWVRIPLMHATYDDTIYIYFGNSGASNQQNATGVWDSNFKGVYHLADGTTLSPNDSTSGGLGNGTNNGATATTGQVDGAGSFDGSTKYIDLGNTGTHYSNLTVEAWANPTSLAATPNIAGKGYDGNTEWDLNIGNVSAGKVGWFTFNGVRHGVSASNASISTGVWTHIVGTFDGNNWKVYINGSLDSNVSDTLAPISTTQKITIGVIYVNGTPYAPTYWPGSIDEVRISNSARSDDWVITEYNNQSSPSTFYSYGALAIQQSSPSTNTSGAGAGWYSSSWTYRKPITIDHNKVSGVSSSTINSFPLLVSVTDTDLKFTGSGGKMASSTAGDLLFTGGDGTTKLDFELEKYSSTTGETIAWVRIPILHATYDDTIYVYFGNNSATNQQNATGVWDSSFKGVWHLGNGTTLGLNDSTSNAYNLTNDSVAATTTKISGGGAWNGNNILQRTTNSNLASPVFTYSYWVKINTTGSHMTMIEPMTGGASHLLQVRLSWDGFNQQMSIQDEGVQQVGKQTTGLLANTIYHLAVSYDASGNYKFYLNGALDGSGTNLVDFSGGTGNFNVGARISKTIENLDGWMDEIKVSNAVRNADWIKTEYNNQSSPSTFYSYGALQTPTKTTRSGFGSQGASTLGWYSSSWSYRKPITIDHNKVGGTSSSTLNSFPLLVSVTDSDLKYTGSGGKMASSTAGDLLFTASDGTTKLDFELEKYSSTTGETIAWVRMPVLHATYDDTIYIYFGNASATNQQNVTGVWDSNFKGVWHMPNGTSLTTNDSTSNANNMTNSNATAGTGMVDGDAVLGGTANLYRADDADFNPSSSFTLSGWAKIDSAGWNDPDGGLYGKNNLSFMLFVNSTGGYFWYINGSSRGTSNISTGVWHHFMFNWDGTNYKLYFDGNTTAAQTYNSASAPSPASGALQLGAYASIVAGDANDRRMKGQIDEYRFSSTARNTDWMVTEFNNQNSPSTFYAYGQLQTISRQTSGGASQPAVKSRGGVRFR